MLYQHKKTGTRIKVVSQWDDGDWFMVEDQDGRIFTVYHTEIEQDPTATKNKITYWEQIGNITVVTYLI